MADEPFNDYLSVIGGLLRLSRARRNEITNELRDHFEERLAELTAAGVPQREAIARAVAEFGDAAALAAEFIHIVRNRKRRWVMRWSIGSMAAAGVLFLAALALWPDGGGPLTQPALAQQTKATAAEADENAKVEETLNKRIDVAFQETPLNDVLSFLADATGVQIYTKWRALENVGTPKDAPITLNLKQIPASMALELVLEQVDSGHDLTFTPQRGIVLVSTKEDLSAKAVVQVYNVRDLLGKDDKAGDASSSPAPGGAPGGMLGMEGGGFGGVGGGGDVAPGGGMMYMGPSVADRLVATIVSSVAPDSWQQSGGSTGSAVIYRGLLVVKHSPSVQTEVAALLKMLREAEAKAGK